MGDGEGSGRLTIQTLPNGLTLINDYMPNRARATVSVTILRGKRDVKGSWSGALHLMEHLATCGSERFPTAKDIDAEAHRLRSMQLVAETDHEFVRFKLTLGANHVIAGAELLHDVVARPRFRARDFVAEKGAVKAEISEDHDKVEEWLSDYAPMVAWGDQHPMGRPILGTPDTISALTLEDLRKTHQRHAVGCAMVVTVSGSNPMDFATAQKIFGEIPPGRPPRPRIQPNWNDGIPSHFDLRQGNTSCYWAILLPGIRSGDPHRLAYHAGSEILEDRLTSIVRRLRGKAYDIRTKLISFTDCGYTEIASAHTGETGPVKPITIERAVETAIMELRRLANDGPTEEELANFKNEEYARLETELDEPETSNEHFADQTVFRKTPLTPEESIQQVEELSLDQVRQQAHRMASKLPQLRMLAVAPRQIEDRLLRAAKRSVKETRERGTDELVA